MYPQENYVDSRLGNSSNNSRCGDRSTEGNGSQRNGHVPHLDRAMGGRDHMINYGTAKPDPDHAYGQRRQDYITSNECLRHEGYELDEPVHLGGRKHATPVDHLFTEVLAPWNPGELNVKVTPDDMRSALREWLVSEYGMKISSQEKWEEVEIAPTGTHWVASCLTSHGRTLSRDGATAQQISLKLSQMPLAELRFFGIRFRHQNEPRSPKPSPRGLRNPSLVSPGVGNAMGQAISGPEWGKEQVEGRKYISSGKSHWEYMNLGEKAEELPEGHPRNSWCQDGIERGIGHGRRHIDVDTHFGDGLKVSKGLGESGGTPMNQETGEFHNPRDNDVAYHRRYAGSRNNDLYPAI